MLERKRYPITEPAASGTSPLDESYRLEQVPLGSAHVTSHISLLGVTRTHLDHV